jgi:TM2 domain-containing membrane protein YozV
MPREHPWFTTRGSALTTLGWAAVGSLASVAVKDASLRYASLRRDPQRVALIAGILSFLVAGLGHFLIAQKLRGAIWLAVWLLATAMIAALGETAAVLAAWLLSALAGADAYLLARAGIVATGRDPATGDQHKPGQPGAGVVT